MFKYAGVTLDYYDDGGALLKEKFPTKDDLPGLIKEAQVPAQGAVPDGAFALVALDSGHALKKFACVDPGTTAMSVIYFMENHEKLPESAVKVAAKNLFDSCIEHQLLPPEQLTKLASSDPVPGVVDITGAKPQAKVAAAPLFDEDYALVLEDGRKMYPIHDWDHIKEACDYWALESRRMQPEHRREYAVKVASKAYDMGYPIDDLSMLEAASLEYADPGHIKTAMHIRELTLPGEDNQVHREFLNDLFEKRASMQPEVFAECVRQFDVMNGLDGGWDSAVPNPWESTFGLQKTARVVWERGNDRVTDRELFYLAKEHQGDLYGMFTEHLIKGFEKDPVGIFESLPEPQKKILARLASHMISKGGSVMESELTDPTKEAGVQAFKRMMAAAKKSKVPKKSSILQQAPSSSSKGFSDRLRAANVFPRA